MGIKQEKNFLLSIRFMTYNHGHYVEESLRSINAQKTNFPFQLVIGDDFSTDDTLQKIKEFKFDNPSITVHILNRKRGDAYDVERQKRGRLYNFLNILENCSGTYVALIDGDDYWTDPLKLQKQVDFLETNGEYVGCFHKTTVKYEGLSEKKLLPWRTYTKDSFTLEDTISKFSLLHTSSFCFRTEKVKMPEWFTTIQSGDMAMFSIVANIGTLYCIQDEMSVYRKNDGGITNTISQLSYHTNRIKLFALLKKYCAPKFPEKFTEVIQFHTESLIALETKNSKNWLTRIFKR